MTDKITSIIKCEQSKYFKKDRDCQTGKNTVGNYMQSTRNSLQIRCHKWVGKKSNKKDIPYKQQS